MCRRGGAFLLIGSVLWWGGLCGERALADSAGLVRAELRLRRAFDLPSTRPAAVRAKKAAVAARRSTAPAASRVAPDANAGLPAAIGIGSTMWVSWPETGGAEGYNVYRDGGPGSSTALMKGAAPDGFVKVNPTLVTAGAYFDRNMSAAVYDYVVSRIEPGGGEVQHTPRFSGEVTGVLPQTGIGMAVTLGHAPGGGYEVQLEWDAAPGALGYWIYRGTFSGGPAGNGIDFHFLNYASILPNLLAPQVRSYVDTVAGPGIYGYVVTQLDADAAEQLWTSTFYAYPFTAISAGNWALYD